MRNALCATAVAICIAGPASSNTLLTDQSPISGFNQVLSIHEMVNIALSRRATSGARALHDAVGVPDLDGFPGRSGYSRGTKGVGQVAKMTNIKDMIDPNLGWKRRDARGTTTSGTGRAPVFDPITVVPVPAMLPIFLAALGGLALLGRRRA